MSYLDQKNWQKATLSKGLKASSRSNPWKKFLRVIICTTTILIVTVAIAGFWTDSKSCFNPYKGIVGVAFAIPPGKPLDFLISAQKMFSDFLKKAFPLGDTISIVSTGKGEKLGTKLDPVRFSGYNIGKDYLHFPATDWVYSARMLKNGHSVEEAINTKDLSTAFQVVPYSEFGRISNDITNSSRVLFEPFLETKGMNGLELGFKRMFADGKTRRIKPNDTWLCLRPNTQGLWRKGSVDRAIGVSSLEPYQSLPIAFYTFTDLCNWQTGEWDIEKTQWLVSRQYSIAYGIYLNPDDIEIVGKGKQALFLYRKKPPVNYVIVRWLNNQSSTPGNWQDNDTGHLMTVPVPIVNEKKQLCFWGSREPDQSIMIPFSYLFTMENDDRVLLGNKNVDVTYQDLLDELQQVRENNLHKKRVVYANTGKSNAEPRSSDFSSYVAVTPRLTEIVDAVVGDAETPDEAVEQIMQFIEEILPYVSDHKTDTSKKGFAGPEEIPMPPIVALWNRGKDCDGHATWAASAYMASKHKAFKDSPKVCALVQLSYHGIGHLVPLLPQIGKFTTDPFPNHILLPVNGVEIPFSYTEPTGNGYDNNALHQDCPQRKSYLPSFAAMIQGHGNSRSVSVVGFNQFKYLPPVLIDN